MLRRKKLFSRPRKTWQLARIKDEGQLIKEYGLKNMTEVWRAAELLRRWRELAKQIVSFTGEKKDKEIKILLDKLQKYAIIGADADIDDVLALELRNLLEKRLQTVIYKKGMSLTPKQARQFIVHNKVMVNSKKVSSPSYLTKANDEIKFVPGFAPQLVVAAKQVQKVEEEKQDG